MGADMCLEEFPVFEMGRKDRRDYILSQVHADNEVTKFPAKRRQLDEEEIQEDRDVANHCYKELMVATQDRDGAHYARNVCVIDRFNEKGQKYKTMVSGGMTWGDSPTEFYSMVSLLKYNLSEEAHEQMLTWAAEDYEAINNCYKLQREAQIAANKAREAEPGYHEGIEELQNIMAGTHEGPRNYC